MILTGTESLFRSFSHEEFYLFRSFKTISQENRERLTTLFDFRFFNEHNLVLHEGARLDGSYLDRMFQVDFPLSVNNILEVKALMYGMYL